MGDKKLVAIIINGTQYETPKDDISYEEIVAMAFPEQGSNSKKTYSIIYRRGQGNKPEETLSPGGFAKVKEGMIFIVTDTSKPEDSGTGEKDEGGKEEEKKTLTIIVNGTPHEVSQDEISYTEVVKLAFPEFGSHPERTYSVTYRRGHGNKPEGILSAGGNVKVKDGMVFDVSETSQS